MDILSKIIELLRGKAGFESLQADEAPNAMAAGVAAASDPQYAAYVREAKSMGETPLSREEFRRTQGGM